VVCNEAKADCRLRDCRQSFVTRLAQNPLVSESTNKGVGRTRLEENMLERYSHVRFAAKQAAIVTLEPGQLARRDQQFHHRCGTEWAQKSDYPLLMRKLSI